MGKFIETLLIAAILEAHDRIFQKMMGEGPWQGFARPTHEERLFVAASRRLLEQIQERHYQAAHWN